jgi:hypothetical protein
MSHGGVAKICPRYPIGLVENRCWVTRVKYQRFWNICVRANPTYDRCNRAIRAKGSFSTIGLSWIPSRCASACAASRVSAHSMRGDGMTNLTSPRSLAIKANHDFEFAGA